VKSLDALPVVLAAVPVDRGDVRLYHKCVDRSRYEAALAASPDAFDVVLWNTDGEVTELTRGNLVVELGGRRLTPPIECGLLAGTLRAELLEQRAVEECVLDRDHLRRADRLWFVNALRGWIPIALAGSASTAPLP
jgi:para-aminobenzoate synthetase / 4-amino-4-deoxychorismate lyase